MMMMWKEVNVSSDQTAETCLKQQDMRCECCLTHAELCHLCHYIQRHIAKWRAVCYVQTMNVVHLSSNQCLDRSSAAEHDTPTIGL